MPKGPIIILNTERKKVNRNYVKSLNKKLTLLKVI